MVVITPATMASLKDVWDKYHNTMLTCKEKHYRTDELRYVPIRLLEVHSHQPNPGPQVVVDMGGGQHMEPERLGELFEHG